MTPPRLLIVEDDPEIAGFLVRGLRAEGYVVESRSTGESLLETVHEGRFALIILDRMLPDAEGVELCRQLRAAGEEVMILMLTARDALGEKLDGLRAGADDYVTKPFAFEELLARIAALLRRSAVDRPAARELVNGELRLDLAAKAAWRGERALGLTATEFALLRHLVENSGAVVSRMEILNAVWGYTFDPSTNIVEVYITYLRKKVDHEDDERLIRNVRGFGYMIPGSADADQHRKNLPAASP